MPQSKSYPEEVVRLIEAVRKMHPSFRGSVINEALEAFPEPEPEPSPGPYRFDNSGDIRDRDNQLVATVAPGKPKLTSLANARLLTAAPELLGACQAAAELAEARRPLAPQSVSVWRKITAAIEKATGKEVSE
jgi:hypothetical protein